MTKKKRITISLDEQSYYNLIRLNKLRGITSSLLIQDLINECHYNNYEKLRDMFLVSDLFYK